MNSIDAPLTRLIADKKLPGIAVSVFKAGEIFMQKGYGYANIENQIPASPTNTLFRIASISKPIAATALAKMVANGIIDLDASFYDYVPYFPKKKWDFTIRQLASHTAGIRGYKGKEYALNNAFSIKEGIGVFKDDDLVFKPGTDYLYNSFDWVLISLAMQEASGLSFNDFVQNEVLDPLNMKDTLAETPKSYEGKLQNGKSVASFYTKNRNGFKQALPVNNNYKLAGGGYLSTAHDIMKFGKAHLERAFEFQSVINEFLSPVLLNVKSTHYGLGWQVSEDNQGRPFYGHIGNSVGAYSNFFVYPNHNTVITILTNCTNPPVQDDFDNFINAVLSEPT